jgi:hypothetical protein
LLFTQPEQAMGMHSIPSRDPRLQATSWENCAPAHESPEHLKAVQVWLAVPVWSQTSVKPPHVPAAPQLWGAHSRLAVLRLHASEPAVGVPALQVPPPQTFGVQVVLRVPLWSQTGWPSKTQGPNGAPQVVAPQDAPSVSRSQGSTVMVIDAVQAPSAHVSTLQVTVRLPRSLQPSP